MSYWRRKILLATVSAFNIAGVRLWFWSDDHEPPHFHAKRAGEWEIKVHFLFVPEKMIEVKWFQKKPSARIRNLVCHLAEKHRAELLREWERRSGR